MQTVAPAAKTSLALKVLNLPDYGRWNRITSTALSADGKWMTYTYQPNDGDATLYARQLDGDKTYTIAIGAAPGGADAAAAGTVRLPVAAAADLSFPTTRVGSLTS